MNYKFIKGIFAGVLAPIVFFAVYVLFVMDEDLFFFIENKINIDNLPKVIVLSLLVNLLIFFMNIYTNREQSARGILFSTMIYGIIIVILKFS